MWALRATCQSDESPSRARARPAGLGEAGRLLTITVGATQLLPTSGRDPEHPCQAGPTWQPLLLALGMEDKLNELTCVQLMLSPVPTSE